MKTKEFKVVMLPTEKATNIAIFNNDYLQDDDNNFRNYTKEGVNKQHLYIVSNDKINKDGELCYSTIEKRFINNQLLDATSKGRLKLLASTDSSVGLPSIPESFIQAYIKSYNESKIIEEVELEMEESTVEFEDNSLTYKKWIKTNSNNEVIIHSKEECNWTTIFMILGNPDVSLGTKEAMIREKYNSPTKK